MRACTMTIALAGLAWFVSRDFRSACDEPRWTRHRIGTSTAEARAHRVIPWTRHRAKPDVGLRPTRRDEDRDAWTRHRREGLVFALYRGERLPVDPPRPPLHRKDWEPSFALRKTLTPALFFSQCGDLSQRMTIRRGAVSNCNVARRSEARRQRGR
jgi:hypothetical protein